MKMVFPFFRLWMSFLQKQESIYFIGFWITVFTGMTVKIKNYTT